MKKAHEIAYYFSTRYGFQIRDFDFENVCQDIEDIINKKCQHPAHSIAEIQCAIPYLKCQDCGKKVQAVKYEEIK